MYESYIQYVDQNGGVKGFRLPFDNARASAFRTKIHKPDLQKSLDPVDRFYSTESLNDEGFVMNYQKKFGEKRKNFLPSFDRKMVIDSHSTLTKVDQARINNILHRNITTYYTYANDKLRNSKLGSSLRESETEKSQMLLYNSSQTEISRRDQVSKTVLDGVSTNQASLDLLPKFPKLPRQKTLFRTECSQKLSTKSSRVFDETTHKLENILALS